MKGYRSPKQLKLNPRKYVTSGGFTLYVGRNNVQNDHVTHKLAGKHDLWFHVKDMPGSHVVMITEGREPGDDDYTEAASVAARYSTAKVAPVAVDYTRAGNVKKPSGAKPGYVIYKTNYTAYVHPATDAEAIQPNDVDPATLERTITFTQDVAYAPIAKGDVLGEITLTYEGRVCAVVPLLAQFDVNASQFLIAKLQVEQFLAQRTVKIAFIAIVILVAAIVIWWKFLRRKRRYGGYGTRRRSHRSYRGRRR
jgi:hypothetical protein